MNIHELDIVNSSILSEEEMINVLGGESLEIPDIPKPDTNSDKCNKCDKCDKCSLFCG
jgi:hypothetical protein